MVGAALLVRSEAVREVGLVDDDFFLFSEEVDWCYRFKRAGWKVLYYPKVTVLHVKRAASRQNPRARVEFQRASLIFYRKHYAAVTPRLLHFAVLMGLLLKGGRPIWEEIRDLG